MSTATKAQIIKHGKIELPIADGNSPYMPMVGGKFVDHGDILKTLAIGIRDNLPIIILGESGCLHPDTPIYDPVDETTKSVKERAETNKTFNVYALNEKQEIIITKAEIPKSYIRTKMYELSDGINKITVTHLHRVWNGESYVHVKDLPTSSAILLPSISESSLSKLLLNDQNSSKITESAKYTKWTVNVQQDEEVYYDFHVPTHENYYACGLFHHNTGKTSAIRFLANETKNGLRRVNLNGGTTADELVGRILINDKGTYWVDGVLTEAMRRGEWIVLDEINAALPEVLFVLQSVLDDDGYLVLNEKDDKEIVHKHPNFRLFATCNPPDYAGTKEMNKALLSRFAICINAEFPTEKIELEIIEHHLGNAIATSEMAVKLVGLAKQSRDEKQLGKADYAINTRDVLNTLKLSELMDPIEALALAFANKLDPADNKALKTMARLHLPSSKKKANQTRLQVTKTEDITIGNTYVIDADLQNTYYGLTDDIDNFSTIIQDSLQNILPSQPKDNSIKGDEFVIDGQFYEDKDDGISSTSLTNVGKKVASAITIIAGPNKGKKALIVHHKMIGRTADIIQNLHEIK